MSALLVLIPTHGRPTLLRRTLDSVAACARPAGYAGCVVVENGPPAGAEAVVRAAAEAHPEAGLRYVHVERANKSHALNVALADVPDEALAVFFDDDVRVSPGVLEAYARAAEGYGGGGAYFGGPFACDYEVPPADWERALLPISAQGMRFDADWVPDFFLGFNWAAFAGDLRAAGGFDPNHGPGSPTGATGQESTMQKALLERGVPAVRVPEAMVWHYVPESRSNPAWAVRRKFKQGMGWGRLSFAAHERDLLGPSVVEVVRCSFSVLKRLALRDRPGAFKAGARLSIKAGYVRGYLAAGAERVLRPGARSRTETNASL